MDRMGQLAAFVLDNEFYELNDELWEAMKHNQYVRCIPISYNELFNIVRRCLIIDAEKAANEHGFTDD